MFFTYLEYGCSVDNLILGIAAALRYDNSQGAQSVEMQAKIKNSGAIETFKEILQVTKISAAVAKAYEQVKSFNFAS